MTLIDIYLYFHLFLTTPLIQFFQFPPPFFFQQLQVCVLSKYDWLAGWRLSPPVPSGPPPQGNTQDRGPLPRVEIALLLLLQSSQLYYTPFFPAFPRSIYSVVVVITSEPSERVAIAIAMAIRIDTSRITTTTTTLTQEQRTILQLQRILSSIDDST